MTEEPKSAPPASSGGPGGILPSAAWFSDVLTLTEKLRKLVDVDAAITDKIEKVHQQLADIVADIEALHAHLISQNSIIEQHGKRIDGSVSRFSDLEKRMDEKIELALRRAGIDPDGSKLRRR
jgi:hypothetical protein